MEIKHFTMLKGNCWQHRLDVQWKIRSTMTNISSLENSEAIEGNSKIRMVAYVDKREEDR